MTSLERRLRKLEANLTDGSGLAPGSQKWLEYWDREIFHYMQDPEHRRPKNLFPLEAVRAVMQWESPESMVNVTMGELRATLERLAAGIPA